MDEITVKTETETTTTEAPSHFASASIRHNLACICKKIPFSNKIANAFTPKNRKKTIIISTLCAFVTFLVIWALIFFSPKTVAKRYVKAYILGDLATQSHLTAYDFKHVETSYYDGDEDTLFLEYSDWFDEDIDSWGDYFKYAKIYYEEELEEEIGTYTYEQRVTKTRSLSNLKSSLGSSTSSKVEEEYVLDLDSISTAKRITIKSKLKGEDEIDKVTSTVYLGKVNGFWKIVYIEQDWEY